MKQAARFFLPTFVLLLTACSHQQPNIEKPLPESSYIARDWPTPPQGEYGPKRLGKYLADAKSAYNDAIAKLDALNPYKKAAQWKDTAASNPSGQKTVELKSLF